MSLEAPKNGIYIVLGEVNYLIAAMKRNVNRYNNHHYDITQDPLIKNFIDLKNLLNSNSDLNDIDATTYLSPFLEIVKSEETNGPITSLALSSIDKFISYGLIDLNSETSSLSVQQIADAVTHARFVGTDTSNDEVVLMKILHVLRTLMLSPIGINLTNSSVCEIMQSCFQIYFEARLGELLRKTAELILIDMVQLLFARLPQFKEDSRMPSLKKLTMKGSSYDSSKQKRKKQKISTQNANQPSNQALNNAINKTNELSASASSSNLESSNSLNNNNNNNNLDSTSKLNEEQSFDLNTNNIDSKNKINESVIVSDSENISLATSTTATVIKDESSIVVSSSEVNVSNNDLTQNNNKTDDTISQVSVSTIETIQQTSGDSDYVNPRGVRFVQDGTNNSSAVPYGLPCVRELLRFLISLINSKNNDLMIQMGLNLIIVALESGVDNIAAYTSLLYYVKDDLCKNLFGLLASERLQIYSFTLRASFLLFESLRGHLKLQLEYFFNKLMEIIISESVKVSYEQKEIALDYIVQMLRIPGFPIELYLNYDCCLNCTNLFEDLTKLLSKNAFPVQGLFTTNSLSLNALLTVIENIEIENTQNKIMTESNMNLRGFIKPPSSGFNVAQALKFTNIEHKTYKPRDSSRTSQRLNRMKVSANLPTQEELKKTKIKKKLLIQGIELFNQSPGKGVQFLRDNGLLDANDLDDLVRFLKQTPALDKKMIGDYVSSRKHVNILEAFVKSFAFDGMRIDESLRIFLETFRLPGEAPLIALVLEHFAEHWRKSNNNQFANADAAFTLAYAVIMLNVDQHNHNVKKQSTPMTVDDFKKNLSKVNGNENFEEELLEDIYSSIRQEEIVMPAEHTGTVRDNYLWKVLIRRSMNPDYAQFMHVEAGLFNFEIFNIIWGQTVAALSFVYDKSLETLVIQKSINGFKKCAQVAANYMMSDVFDNIVISLCKFTTLLSQSESYDQLPIYFGMNNKAQLACKTVFQLTHNHGDMLRDGWKNILDCVIQLYKAKLLPRVLLECEDFLNTNGRIYLIKEENPVTQKQEGGSLFSFFPFMSQDSSNNKGPTPEEQEAIKSAQSIVDECHIEQLIHDTKFLRVDSLLELIKALIFLSQSSEQYIHSDNDLIKYDQDAAVFSLEILIKVVLQNRDRISCIWLHVRNHFYNIICHSNEYTFFLERTVIGLLRISARLLRREELANEVLSSLRMLLLIKANVIRKISRQVAYGLHDLLRTNAANIHSSDDWLSLFSILQVIGAGAPAPPIITSPLAQINQTIGIENKMISSDPDLSDRNKFESTNLVKNQIERDKLERGYTSDSELYNSTNISITNATSNVKINSNSNTDISGVSPQQRNDWILVNKEDLDYMKSQQNLVNQYKIDLDEGLDQHDKKAFLKCCEILAFLVRDAAHITPDNFESCVHCLRTFVEACVCSCDRENKKKQQLQQQKNQGNKSGKNQRNNNNNNNNAQQIQQQKSVNKQPKHQQSINDLSNYNQNSGTLKHSYTYHGQIISENNEEDEDEDSLTSSYETISHRLLDLLDTLHNKATSIFTQWSDEKLRSPIQTVTVIDINTSLLWTKCWCPILQGIARLSCDSNGEVRMQALQYLQRALLVHDLQTLSAVEWEACFNKVLFPLLAKLLENIDPQNLVRMEETRMRASTLLCKVFLQHLTTLARLSTFTALWLTILDYMDKYMKSDKSDLLRDVIPESLKNMLLVMETTGLFNQHNQDTKFTQLCLITKDRIELFLPGLWDELFKTTPKTQNNNDSIEEIPKLDSNNSVNEIEQQKQLGNINDLQQKEAAASPPNVTESISQPNLHQLTNKFDIKDL